MAPARVAISLSGTGQTATNTFDVDGGLTVFNATHGGTSNFSIELLDGNGKLVEVLVNVIGPYNGSVGTGLDAGKYVLKIDADGHWTVNITQPRKTIGVALPHTFGGKGQQFAGPFHAYGGVRLQATHTGQSNFAIEVLGADGALKEAAVNEIGSYNGSTVVSNLGGDYYLKIDADGNWTATVSAI